ncbi:MAG: tail-specific protease [Verrucomicrobiaceae bacterium]|nr:tail-specific protease [Verrucomicrobiaceae bacterium]
MNTNRNIIGAFLSTIAVGITLQTSAISAPSYGTIAQYVANLVQNNHYSRTDFEDDVSEELLKSFVSFLDTSKLYFTQEDIDTFERKYKTSLDDHIFEGSIKPATDIYSIYVKRVQERVAKIEEILKTVDFKFDSDRTVEKRRKDSEWPADKAASDVLWKNVIEGQLLAEELRTISQKERAKELGKKLEDILGSDSNETPKEKILKRYTRFMRSLDENDEEEICNFFMSTLSQVYDPHSEYFSQSELENFRVNMGNKLVGIGALLSTEDGGAAKIQGIVVGGPADKAGELQINDRIVGVGQGEDGEIVDIMYMKLNKIVDMIRGKKGTVVVLKIIPADAADDSQTRKILINRDQVNLKDKLANAELIEVSAPNNTKQRIGWINLYAFYADMQRGTSSCSADVKKLLERLKAEKIEGLVVDLRGNGGGSLEEAIRMTGLFIPSGPVVQAKNAKNKITDRTSRTPLAIYDGPLVVLTDRSSASASEIFAAALQDYQRAVIIGDKSTFGKGTVQTVMPVAQYMPVIFPRETKERAGALKVTIQKFYRIAGGSTQLEGVVPDIILPSYRDEIETGEASLPNALEHDAIRKMKYNLFEHVPPIEKLRALSMARLNSEKEFQYIKEDNKRFKDAKEKNTISLNLKKRMAETAEEKERRHARNAERTKLFAKINERENGRYKVAKITLDNVAAKEFKWQENFKPDDNKSMRRAKDKEEELAEKTPDFPHFLPAAKREMLNITGDLISISKDLHTAETKP